MAKRSQLKDETSSKPWRPSRKETPHHSDVAPWHSECTLKTQKLTFSFPVPRPVPKWRGSACVGEDSGVSQNGPRAGSPLPPGNRGPPCFDSGLVRPSSAGVVRGAGPKARQARGTLRVSCYLGRCRFRRFQDARKCIFYHLHPLCLAICLGASGMPCPCSHPSAHATIETPVNCQSASRAQYNDPLGALALVDPPTRSLGVEGSRYGVRNRTDSHCARSEWRAGLPSRSGANDLGKRRN